MHVFLFEGSYLIAWSKVCILIFSSVSALLMMVTLKKLASTGCTLIFTIYQSSTEVFGLFDRICLLSNGNTLFFGETLACLQVSSYVDMSHFPYLILTFHERILIPELVN